MLVVLTLSKGASTVILSAEGAKDLLSSAPKADPSLRARSARSAQDDRLARFFEMVEATRLLVQPMRVLVHEMCVSFRRLGDIPRKSADWSNARVHWFSKTAFRST